MGPTVTSQKRLGALRTGEGERERARGLRGKGKGSVKECGRIVPLLRSRQAVEASACPPSLSSARGLLLASLVLGMPGWPSCAAARMGQSKSGRRKTGNLAEQIKQEHVGCPAFSCCPGELLGLLLTRNSSSGPELESIA